MSTTIPLQLDTLSTLSKDQLVNIARSYRLRGYSSLPKPELIQHILTASGAADSDNTSTILVPKPKSKKKLRRRGYEPSSSSRSSSSSNYGMFTDEANDEIAEMLEYFDFEFVYNAIDEEVQTIQDNVGGEAADSAVREAITTDLWEQLYEDLKYKLRR